MTPEEKELYAERYASGQLISYKWLMSEIGSRYIQNNYNFSLLMNWLKRHGKADEWSLENLDEAFLATEAEMLAEEPEPEAEPLPEPEPLRTPTQEELYGPFAGLTKQQVAGMSGSDMRKFGRDPRFAARINSLLITRADLARKE
jgi:hypothetical protein